MCLLKAMRGSTIQFNNTRLWPTALCNFLCSDVSWWKADGCSRGMWLSKHRSLCVHFVVSPPTKLDLRPAFTICRMASYVHMELPFLSLVVTRRGTLFFEISGNCSFFSWKVHFHQVCRRLCEFGVTHLCHSYICRFFHPSSAMS